LYTIIIEANAKKYLDSLPKDLATRIWNKIKLTKEEPHKFFQRLKGSKNYRLRVGKYRAIVTIDDEKQIITILLIGHRKNIYD
jgi:mRNA interferase RelE/StbE